MRAIEADDVEASRRMRVMQRHLRGHDVRHWANSFLSALGVEQPGNPPVLAGAR
jgi:trehalose 6-phosphate synthase